MIYLFACLLNNLNNVNEWQETGNKIRCNAEINEQLIKVGICATHAPLSINNCAINKLHMKPLSTLEATCIVSAVTCGICVNKVFAHFIL